MPACVMGTTYPSPTDANRHFLATAKFPKATLSCSPALAPRDHHRHYMQSSYNRGFAVVAGGGWGWGGGTELTWSGDVAAPGGGEDGASGVASLLTRTEGLPQAQPPSHRHLA